MKRKKRPLARIVFVGINMFVGAMFGTFVQVNPQYWYIAVLMMLIVVVGVAYLYAEYISRG